MRYVARIGVIVLIAVALLLSTTPVIHANEVGDRTHIAVDLFIRGGSEVDIHVTGGSELDVSVGEPGEAHIYIGDDPKTVIDIHITGHGEVDAHISGPCEVNVRVEGPAKVNIDAGDEVKLNVEASDESQVFLDDRSPDNPAQTDDPSATYQESGDIDEHSSRLDDLAIISGAFLAVGLPILFLIRRKAKKANNERR